MIPNAPPDALRRRPGGGHLLLMAAVALGLSGGALCAQGDLYPPPGPPAPSMKTLDQIEARTPISSLPFTIADSGSYYLTGNLTAPAGVDGITIEANDVTIDLNGFVLSGSGGDSGHGIYQSAATYQAASIRNGSLTNWQGSEKAALQLEGEANRVEGILASENNLAIFTGPGAVIRDCTARDNGGAVLSGGIVAGAGSVVSHCTAHGNTITGGTGVALFAGDGSVIEKCAATANVFAGSSALGIGGGSGAVIRDSAAHGNTGSAGFTGISVSDGGEISDCSCYGNSDSGGTSLGISGGSGTVIRHSSVRAMTANGSLGAGMSVGFGGAVIECSVHGLSGTATNRYGILGLGEASIRRCTVRDCEIGIRVSNGCLVRGNLCSGNASAGIEAVGSGGACTIAGNVVRENGTGIFVQGENANNVVTGNRASGSTSANYSIASGNIHGPLVSVSMAGDLSAVTNADHPLANLSY